MCWFPLGLLGILVANDVPVPGEVNVGISIIVLPLNAVLNPFLYTLNLILERRKREKEAQLMKRLTAQLQSKTTPSHATHVVDKLKLSYSAEEVQSLLEKWIADGSLSKEQFKSIVRNK